jgi:hypothetical protein
VWESSRAHATLLVGAATNRTGVGTLAAGIGTGGVESPYRYTTPRGWMAPPVRRGKDGVSLPVPPGAAAPPDRKGKVAHVGGMTALVTRTGPRTTVGAEGVTLPELTALIGLERCTRWVL